MSSWAEYQDLLIASAGEWHLEVRTIAVGAERTGAVALVQVSSGTSHIQEVNRVSISAAIWARLVS